LGLVAFLEAWVFCPFVEEVLKRLVLVNQLLDKATGNGFAQPRAISSLKFGQLSAQRNIIERLLAFFIRLFLSSSAQFQTKRA
jgi:hypothetical protein